MGKISTQCHAIFDDCFETVLSLPMGDNIQQQWHCIIKFPFEYYLDVNVDQNGFPIFDNDATFCHTGWAHPLELLLRSLPYDDHPDLPSFSPVGDVTSAPDGAPEGDSEGVSVGDPMGIPPSAPKGVSADHTSHPSQHVGNAMTIDDTAIPPSLWPGEISDNHTTVLSSSHPWQQHIGTYKDSSSKIR